MNEKVIDWELAKQLAGGKIELAKELFQMLIDSLPEYKKDITKAFEEKNFEQLAKAAHKLHGATCYCGTPRLKKAVQHLEIVSTTEQIQEIQQAYKKTLDEIDSVLGTGPPL